MAPQMSKPAALLLLLLLPIQSSAFSLPQPTLQTAPSRHPPNNASTEDVSARRSFLVGSAPLLLLPFLPAPSYADDFESIAARAAAVSAQITQEENTRAREEEEERKSSIAQQLKEDTRSVYDFELPVGGKSRSVGELVGSGAKAILVVNIKQDDPLARKNIPELIALVERWDCLFLLGFVSAFS